MFAEAQTRPIYGPAHLYIRRTFGQSTSVTPPPPPSTLEQITVSCASGAQRNAGADAKGVTAESILTADKKPGSHYYTSTAGSLCL